MLYYCPSTIAHGRRPGKGQSPAGSPGPPPLPDTFPMHQSQIGLSTRESRLADARKLPLKGQSISGLITSSPYPNRHDYSRVFHIELLLMGSTEPEITSLRHSSLRSHVEAKRQKSYENRLRRYRKPQMLENTLTSLPEGTDRRIRADEETIAKSLHGHWREEHIFELTQALELYRVYQGKIAECDREIEAQLERFDDRGIGQPPAAKSGRRGSQGNAPRFDMRTQLYRMTGVDLTRIDGVDGYTALKVVSEIGTNMSKWPSAKHFASWLGLSPNNRVTGGKVISSRTKPNSSGTSI